MPEDANGAIGQRFERYRLACRLHSASHFGDNARCGLLDLRGVKPWFFGQQRLFGAFAAHTAFHQKRDEIGLADFAIADRGVWYGGVVTGINNRAACMCAQAVQNRREVGIAREQHELIKVGLVLKKIEHVHDHLDVCGILQLGRERRAIHNFETGPQELVAHKRERVHVRGVVGRIATRRRVSVTAVQHDPAWTVQVRALRRSDEAPVLDASQPSASILGETARSLFVLALQR